MENQGRYFKSVEEWKDSLSFKKEFQEREFMANPDMPGGLSDTSEGVSRREFVKMMAGGMALLSLTGCRRPEGHIVPMAEQPENRVVGNPLFYMTSESREGEAIPLMVETHGGRPTKVEGNARFSAFAGATDTLAQAHVLDLYDPDRTTKHYKNGGVILRADVMKELSQEAVHLGVTQGEGTVVLAHPTTSPTLLAAKNLFLQKYPQAKWVEYSAFDRNKFSSALRASTGRNLRAKWNFERADRILALDCDFLTSETGSIHYAKEFAARRRPHSADEAQHMNRLYSVESVMSLTGAQADHRLRLDDRELTNFAARLLAELQRLSGSTPRRELMSPALSEAAQVWLTPMARDLWDRRNSGALVVCGSHQSSALQQLVFAINDLLGAEGRTLTYIELPSSRNDAPTALEDAQQIILFGCNPAYDAPQNFNWNKIVARTPKIISWSYRTDETTLTLPKENLQVLSTHGLESWGLGAAFDGTLVAQQPMIEPLFGGIEPLEFWSALCGENKKPRDWTKEIYAARTGKGSEKDFNDFLNFGFEKNSASPAVQVGGLPSAAWASLRTQLETQNARAKKGGLSVILRPSYTVGTGERANNSWLQECPDPMTKLTWGNSLFVSAKTAAELGYTPGSDSVLPVSAKPLANLDRGRQRSPVVLLQVGEKTLKVPLSIQPGMPDGTALLNLGYGHTKFGRNADNVGVNAFPLVEAAGLYALDGVTLKMTSETVLLANTQNHWSIEGRDHYREGDKEDFLKNERFAQSMGIESHAPSNFGTTPPLPLSERVKETPRGNSAFEHPNYTAAQQWGLSIDLSSCTGCNACVIACQSENNIPSVGREQMLRGREMHWIRIDRYYATGSVSANQKEAPSEVDVGVQPMTCQHCERAPCEQVCPVNATVHDEQGLNVMAYNRCVGTRYCANNCPYKVRRFNFFDYAKRNRENYYWGMFGPEGMPDILKLQKNPDVTIRSRGVMEKCTLCVQRIEQAKIRQRILAKDSGNTNVADGIIRTACQQACPSQAIVFGDVADDKTQISKLKHSPRDYSALGYLNTRPRLTYLARIRNQNRAMPDYRAIVRFRLEQGAGKSHGGEGHGEEHHEHAHEEAHS